MRKKQFCILLIVFLFINVGAISLAFYGTAKSDDGVRPLEEVAIMDLTHENFVKREIENAGVSGDTGGSPIVQLVTPGDQFIFTVSDDGLGIEYDETFVVVLDGTHGIILITKDAYDSFDGTYYHFENPIGDDSEPWLRTEDLVSQDDLEYMLDQFDTVMYPTVADVFGEPLPRGDEGTKVWTLIFNIRDEAYYNPAATSYIAGYFSASESSENNKNIMHIDTYDWENRVGPDVGRPYLYEGTFAHEFEHMVHSDIDPNEPSWTDEGLADLSGFLCGYGHSSGHIAYYFVYHETTPLTFWGGGLPDYGASYLFALYMLEHYGGVPFISALVQEQANGIEGLENTLAAFGYSETFDEIFDDWTIANYIDDTRKSKGKYGYDTLDVGTVDTWGYSLEWSVNTFFSPPFDFPFGLHSSWWFGDPQPYTAHYFRFTNEFEAEVWIDGDDWTGLLPYEGVYEWYSDAEAWAWRSLYQTFDIPLGGATLNFMTYFEIEDDWDYGYVEVYDQDTGEWYTLQDPSLNIQWVWDPIAEDFILQGMREYVAHGQNNPNCPVGREPTDYEAATRLYAFTGASNGWVDISMDLGVFAGHTIDLYFTTWQDGAYTLQMMWVDQISIPEIGFSDGAEFGEGDWISTGWYVSDGMFDNGWAVTVIDTKGVPFLRYPIPTNNAMHLHKTQSMLVDPLTHEGSLMVSETPAESGRVKVAIVTNRADHILFSGYWFGVNW